MIGNHGSVKEREKAGKTMQDCGNHHECVVVYNGEDCPLCLAEKILKNLAQEVEKSMVILKDFKRAAEEVGLKFH